MHPRSKAAAERNRQHVINAVAALGGIATYSAMPEDMRKLWRIRWQHQLAEMFGVHNNSAHAVVSRVLLELSGKRKRKAWGKPKLSANLSE